LASRWPTRASTSVIVSQRRFWECEFGPDLNLYGWTRKLSGKPTISVSSAGIDLVLEMIDRGDFDLIAVGRG